VRRIPRKIKDFFIHRILHADDTPHRIALGLAIGTFVATTPALGLHTVMAIGLAALLRANKAAAVSFVWINNPFTFVPVYGSALWLGSLLVPGDPTVQSTIWQELTAPSTHGSGFLHNAFSYDFWAGVLQLMVRLGLQLWVGSLILGLAAAATLYFLTRWAIQAYRARHHSRIMLQGESGEPSTTEQPAKDLVSAVGDSG
jgi:uncharacterized protein